MKKRLCTLVVLLMFILTAVKLPVSAAGYGSLVISKAEGDIYAGGSGYTLVVKQNPGYWYWCLNFLAYPNITKIVISDGVSSIASGAFSGLDHVRTMVIPASCTSIEFDWSFPKGVSIVTSEGSAADKMAKMYGLSVTYDGSGSGSSTNVEKKTVNTTLDYEICEEGDKVILKINGSGATPGFDGASRPWESYIQSITHVEIGEGITDIGDSMFMGMKKLTEVSFPNSLTSIGKMAFYGCDALNNVLFPENLETISLRAFDNCTSLSSMHFCGKAPKLISDPAFTKVTATVTYDCGKSDWNKITSKTFGGTITWEATHTWEQISTTIEADCEGNTRADFNCKTCFTSRTIEVPNSKLGHKYSKPKWTWTPSGDSYTVSMKAVCANNASHVIEKEAKVEKKVVRVATEKNTGLITYTATVDLGTLPVDGQSVLTDVREVETSKLSNKVVEKTGTYTLDFKKKTATLTKADAKLATSSIPSAVKDANGKSYKVTAIADKAFKGNKKVKSVIVPAGVTTVGNSAFYGCTALTKISFGAKINKIGSKAFYGCTKLKSFTITSTKLKKSNIGASAFTKMPATAKYMVPSSKVKAYSALFKSKGAKGTVKKK